VIARIFLRHRPRRIVFNARRLRDLPAEERERASHIVLELPAEERERASHIVLEVIDEGLGRR
jgi:hypothetical protein